VVHGTSTRGEEVGLETIPPVGREDALDGMGLQTTDQISSAQPICEMRISPNLHHSSSGSGGPFSDSHSSDPHSSPSPALAATADSFICRRAESTGIPHNTHTRVVELDTFDDVRA